MIPRGKLVLPAHLPIFFYLLFVLHHIHCDSVLWNATQLLWPSIVIPYDGMLSSCFDHLNLFYGRVWCRKMTKRNYIIISIEQSGCNNIDWCSVYSSQSQTMQPVPLIYILYSITNVESWYIALINVYFCLFIITCEASLVKCQWHRRYTGLSHSGGVDITMDSEKVYIPYYVNAKAFITWSGWEMTCIQYRLIILKS